MKGGPAVIRPEDDTSNEARIATAYGKRGPALLHATAVYHRTMLPQEGLTSKLTGLMHY